MKTERLPDGSIHITDTIDVPERLREYIDGLDDEQCSELEEYIAAKMQEAIKRQQQNWINEAILGISDAPDMQETPFYKQAVADMPLITDCNFVKIKEDEWKSSNGI